ncbi:uncharacterized protein [Amphiura filiformis]|uniref:uncharacterized protein n=1 Tax=Amphiura filiformis TaxID=82378 RepID=UPI003B2281D2
MEDFKCDLEKELAVEAQPDADVNMKLNNFNIASTRVLNQHVPSSTRTRKIRPRFPWYSQEISEARRVTRKLERRFRRTHLQCDRDNFNKQRMHVNKLIDRSKACYYKDALKDADTKQTFRILGSVMHQNVKALPSFDTPDVLSNKFALSFNEKVFKIRSGIDNNVVVSDHKDLSIRQNIAQNIGVNLETHMSSFKLLDDSEVHEIVASSADKTCNLDCVPTWLLKSNISVVLPYIAEIVNTSLQCGVFPSELKQAIVTPILKKSSLDWNDLTNYRPVSNVNYIGKVIEKAAISQINEHIESNGLDESLQSAYKCRHSTETALLVVKNDIMTAIDENQAVFLVMLDLSAAFDTIDHTILFNRLECDFGIKGTALEWFQSYMTDRNFQTALPYTNQVDQVYDLLQTPHVLSSLGITGWLVVGLSALLVPNFGTTCHHPYGHVPLSAVSRAI